MLHNSGLTSVIIRPITAYINNVVVCSSFGWREVLQYRGPWGKSGRGVFLTEAGGLLYNTNRIM